MCVCVCFFIIAVIKYAIHHITVEITWKYPVVTPADIDNWI